MADTGQLLLCRFREPDPVYGRCRFVRSASTKCLQDIWIRSLAHRVSSATRRRMSAGHLERSAADTNWLEQATCAESGRQFCPHLIVSASVTHRFCWIPLDCGLRLRKSPHIGSVSVRKASKEMSARHRGIVFNESQLRLDAFAVVWPVEITTWHEQAAKQKWPWSFPGKQLRLRLW